MADDARRGVVVLAAVTPVLAAAVGVAITLATDGKSALLTILPGVPRVRLRPAPTRLLRQPSPAPHGALRPHVATTVCPVLLSLEEAQHRLTSSNNT